MNEIITKIKENKKTFIVGFIVLFLILTNPTLDDFKVYKGTPFIDYVRKESNYFIFSIYRVEDDYYEYIGIADNFFSHEL